MTVTTLEAAIAAQVTPANATLATAATALNTMFGIADFNAGNVSCTLMLDKKFLQDPAKHDFYSEIGELKYWPKVYQVGRIVDGTGDVALYAYSNYKITG